MALILSYGTASVVAQTVLSFPHVVSVPHRVSSVESSDDPRPRYAAVGRADSLACRMSSLCVEFRIQTHSNFSTLPPTRPPSLSPAHLDQQKDIIFLPRESYLRGWPVNGPNNLAMLGKQQRCRGRRHRRRRRRRLRCCSR